MDSDNSCLVSELALLLYINNKEPLDLATQILNSKEFDYEIEDIVKLLKWNTRTNSPTSGFFGPSTNSVNMGYGPSTVPAGSSTSINQMASEVVGNFIANELTGMFSGNPEENENNQGQGFNDVYYSFFPRPGR